MASFKLCQTTVLNIHDRTTVLLTQRAFRIPPPPLQEETECQKPRFMASQPVSSSFKRPLSGKSKKLGQVRRFLTISAQI